MSCSEEDEVINLDDSANSEGKTGLKGVHLPPDVVDSCDWIGGKSNATRKPVRVKWFVPQPVVQPAAEQNEDREGQRTDSLKAPSVNTFDAKEDSKEASWQKSQELKKKRLRWQLEKLRTTETATKHENLYPEVKEVHAKATQTLNSQGRKGLDEKMMYKMKEKQLNQQVDQLKKELSMCKKKLAKEIRNFEKQEVRRLLTADKSVLDSENEDVIVEGKGLLENRCSVSEKEKKDLEERLEQSESDNARMKRELDNLAAKFSEMQRNMEIAKPLNSGVQGEAVKNNEANKSEFVDETGLALDITISNRGQIDVGAGDDQYKKGKY